MSELEATGERLVPERQHGQLVHAEHLARYRLAAQLAPARRVLDAACGVGYGTALLAHAGARVAVGVDLDEATVVHARERHPGASFEVADVRELPFPGGSFDLTVSFETIEHVAHPERVLDELRRVTAGDGWLLISTPNKHRYLAENEYHERELFHEEFVALLRERFERVELLLQHNWLTSAVLPHALAADAAGEERHDLPLWKLAGIEPGGELYTLALCGSGEPPALAPVGVMAGLDEAHELSQRLRESQAEYERWHDQFARTRDELLSVYGSVWWRGTAPLRRVAGRLGRKRD